MAKTAGAGSRTRFQAGPFKGVRSDQSPYNDPPDLLTDGLNLVFPDPTGNISCFGRPAFQLVSSDPIYTSAAAFRCQLIYSHPALDGTRSNFVVMGGRLFRKDVDGFTDVTPVDVTIDPNITTLVYAVSIIGTLMFTDGVNRPWIATDLDATPITGTYIDYDGAGSPWTTIGNPVLWQNSAIVMMNQVNGVSRRTDISWSQPGDLSTGWQQAIFDNNWTLETSSAGILYALQATNQALYYFRAQSIGTATGTIGPDLASSATEDSISFNVGTQAAQTVQQFGNAFFFCDALGRPWRYVPGSAPEPIWTQMQIFVRQNSTGAPSVTGLVSTSVIEPLYNLYLVGIWSPSPTTLAQVTELYVFDATTGTFEGRWEIGDGVSIDRIGTFVDSAGRVTVIVAGSQVAGGPNGYLWSMNVSSVAPLTRVTMSGRTRITMSGRTRVTQASAVTYNDAGELTRIRAVTGRMGYADDTIVRGSAATVITNTSSPVRVSATTSAMTETVEGIPSPMASADDTFRLPVGLDVVGRGPRLVIEPLDTTEQWGLQSVSMTATLSQAGWDDP